ncbi:MAG: acyl carrier protein [Alphaproteobacteria bacterium]|nr:acyl carrier protein [Alphaproteobacteria bacterium]MBU1514506.1 acyl carrier protein [Alphaproteobacteria bacterium]MBU2096862.1 acyl carrier protein [Alphaproteobacteria bacterium]MBU2153489.1 acyl carrier protein [Alphaproteobacteria bacterium]MBU2306006.1 acyl carrier protein [Alphaproteobacteria bacterium]
MTERIDAEIAEILSLTLGRPVAAGENLTRADEPKWDSLKHLEIVFAVEGAYGVAFSPEEIAAVTGAADLKAKVLSADAA